MITFRRLNDGDIPAALQLCRYASWNQLETDWQAFLQLSPDGCLAACSGDRLVGTVATVSYEDAFSWVGMVLVHPEFKRQGIGTQLLLEALKLLKQQNCIKLDATPQGRPLYLTLEFRDEYSLQRMVADRVSFSQEDVKDIHLITPAHMRSIAKFDSGIFGANREPLLKLLVEHSPDLAFIKLQNEECAGFCMGRNGHGYTHIGPVVAENFDIAKQLVFSAMHQLDGRPVMLDTMLHDSSWLKWLQSCGFKVQRPFVRMFRGENCFQGILDKQFAITGPEFG